MKKLLLFLPWIAIYGCATQQPYTYQKYGASESDLQTAKMECEYDVAKATQNNRYFFSMGDAIASGIMQGAEISRLRDLCMQSKGFTKSFANSGTSTAWVAKDYLKDQETSPTAGNPPNGSGL